ncbi:N-acetyl-gamma-glutamyl-phosphate reductase OS=Streptomyces microflavus OX=1919 GN=argC PE=3 SV=1 [Streptomyces microflavus]
MVVRAAVAGASGYAGGELLRLLLVHPGVEIGALTGHSNAGQTLGSLQPHLRLLAGRVLEPTTAEVLAGHDVVFLALPHGQSAAVAEQLGDEVLVVDMGADFRLRMPVTGRSSTGPRTPGPGPTGCPSCRVGGPCSPGPSGSRCRGCYPAAVSLALFPAYEAGIAEPEAVIVAASGTSGAGKAAKPHLLGSEVMGNMTPYGVGGGHRHMPEMIQNLSAAAGEPVTVSFTPTLAPMPRGILATCSAKAKPGVGAESLRAVYEKAFADEPFVDLLPEGQWPATAAVYGSNAVQVQVAHDGPPDGSSSSAPSTISPRAPPAAPCRA